MITFKHKDIPIKTNLISSFFLCCIASVLMMNTGCAFKSVTRSKNITYFPADTSRHIEAQQLNIFAPKKSSSLKEVLIFIHGGSWNSGKKSTYNFLGNRFARKGVIMVIIDYPLSPAADYKDMAITAEASVNWVKENIYKYGGDPHKIFISGHSAGGHLAALIGTSNDYFNGKKSSNPLKGIILIDAAGLDMYTYLKEENFPEGNTYINTFTNDPVNWKDASPLYHIHNGMPPMLIYRGGKTYPSIKSSNEKFVATVTPLAPATIYHVIKGKKHVPMITQFLFTYNKRYQEILGFMKQQN
ncbi:MAG: alpha/beta hydrolase [Ferruginibacter sp.]